MRPPRRSTLIISPFLVHSYAWPNYGNSGASISSGANWSNATAPLIVSNGSRQCEGPTCSGLCCLADATCCSSRVTCCPSGTFCSADQCCDSNSQKACGGRCIPIEGDCCTSGGDWCERGWQCNRSSAFGNEDFCISAIAKPESIFSHSFAVIHGRGLPYPIDRPGNLLGLFVWFLIIVGGVGALIFLSFCTLLALRTLGWFLPKRPPRAFPLPNNVPPPPPNDPPPRTNTAAPRVVHVSSPVPLSPVMNRAPPQGPFIQPRPVQIDRPAPIASTSRSNPEVYNPPARARSPPVPVPIPIPQPTPVPPRLNPTLTRSSGSRHQPPPPPRMTTQEAYYRAQLPPTRSHSGRDAAGRRLRRSDRANDERDRGGDGYGEG